MILITQAKYIKDYKIELVFSDNFKGIIDLENVINQDKRPIFQELKDKNKFSKIVINLDTITWQNGLDFAPEFLYELLLKQNKTD